LTKISPQEVQQKLVPRRFDKNWPPGGSTKIGAKGGSTKISPQEVQQKLVPRRFNKN
jgi:hypothetical protein